MKNGEVGNTGIMEYWNIGFKEGIVPSRYSTIPIFHHSDKDHRTCVFYND
jgi:hypothetical protein